MCQGFRGRTCQRRPYQGSRRRVNDVYIKDFRGRVKDVRNKDFEDVSRTSISRMHGDTIGTRE